MQAKQGNHPTGSLTNVSSGTSTENEHNFRVVPEYLNVTALISTFSWMWSMKSLIWLSYLSHLWDTIMWMGTLMFLLAPDELGNLPAVLLSAICGNMKLHISAERSSCREYIQEGILESMILHVLNTFHFFIETPFSLYKLCVYSVLLSV